MYTITEIEDAIISTLKSTDMASYCKKIDSYQIEGGDLEDQIRIFAGQLPCALVIYSGTPEFIYSISGVQDAPMIFSILLCAQSLRGKGEARKGIIGTYQMIDDLRKFLTNNQVGLDIDPLMPTKIEGEINTKMFSAYSMEFKTKVRYNL
jgi:phage gp37-like protein